MASRNREKKAVIFGIYFGPLPIYFNLFARSCGENEDFDWILIGDQFPSTDYPKNVKVIKQNFEDFRAHCDKSLGFKTALQRPYKICDFRPALGFLFPDLCSEYPFWGTCDIDIIFGKISNVVEPQIWNNYDKILAPGHLTFIRNTETFNRAFMQNYKGLGFREVFSNPKAFFFDENPGINGIFLQNNYRLYWELTAADINWIKSSRFEGNHVKNYPYQAYVWLKGRMLRFHYEETSDSIQETEYSYIHLQKRKHLVWMCDLKTDNIAITPRGFYPVPENLTRQDLKRLNKPIFIEWIGSLLTGHRLAFRLPPKKWIEKIEKSFSSK